MVRFGVLARGLGVAGVGTGRDSKGAGAFCGMGMVRAVPHPGHLTLRPTALSGAFRALRQEGQATVIGMVYLVFQRASESPMVEVSCSDTS